MGASPSYGPSGPPRPDGPSLSAAALPGPPLSPTGEGGDRLAWERTPRAPGGPVAAAVRRILGSTWLLVATLSLSVAALVVTALFVIPTPYQVLLPGPVTDVQRLIEPNPNPGKGALFLTTIYSDPASVGEWLFAKVNPEAGIVPREEARPKEVTDKQYQKLLVSMMDESKVAAKVVALREAGYDVKVTGQGAEVRELADGSKAKGLLQPGDVIVAVDGQPVATSNDLIATLQARRPGETVHLDVRRGGNAAAPDAVDVPLGESPDEPGRARVGIVVLTHLYEYQLPREVDLKTKDVGGPSGGLMFALGVYNAVTEGDVTAGRKIAGTGTIATDGKVGAVGGVRYKVRAAERAGADLFLVPQDNLEEAQQAAHGLRIVPVQTFGDALQALHQLDPAA
jgi:PDZ domain-containing protein